MKKALAILLLFFIGAFAVGEVYLLSPWKWGKSDRWRRELDFTVLMTEPAVYNGVKLELEIGISKYTLSEFLTGLKKNYPQAQFEAGGDYVRVSAQGDSKDKRDEFLLIANHNKTVSVIHMERPYPAPKIDKWPDELPKPYASAGEEYLYLPKRNAVYGTFSAGLSGRQALFEVSEKFRSLGFKPLASDQASPTGNIFLNEKQREIAWVGISPQGSVSVYRRTLSK